MLAEIPVAFQQAKEPAIWGFALVVSLALWETIRQIVIPALLKPRNGKKGELTIEQKILQRMTGLLEETIVMTRTLVRRSEDAGKSLDYISARADEMHAWHSHTDTEGRPSAYFPRDAIFDRLDRIEDAVATLAADCQLRGGRPTS